MNRQLCSSNTSRLIVPIEKETFQDAALIYKIQFIGYHNAFCCTKSYQNLVFTYVKTFICLRVSIYRNLSIDFLRGWHITGTIRVKYASCWLILFDSPVFVQ